MLDVTYEPCSIPEDVRISLVRLLREFGLRFAACDFVVDDEGWQFLEVNPNGQWAWLDLEGVSSIAQSLLNALTGKS
jgi:glutathione synthase/RimK-type ligase-like ATP-grasp enzyme